jgi:hypothetical protein
MNEHYEKYQDTIKKVSRRNYQKRVFLLNEFLTEKSCIHCGEQNMFVLNSGLMMQRYARYPKGWEQVMKVVKRYST